MRMPWCGASLNYQQRPACSRGGAKCWMTAMTDHDSKCMTFNWCSKYWIHRGHLSYGCLRFWNGSKSECNRKKTQGFDHQTWGQCKRGWFGSKSWAKVGWLEKMAVGPQILKDVPGACADLAIRSVQKDVDSGTIPLADAPHSIRWTGSSISFPLVGRLAPYLLSCDSSWRGQLNEVHRVEGRPAGSGITGVAKSVKTIAFQTSRFFFSAYFQHISAWFVCEDGYLSNEIIDLLQLMLMFESKRDHPCWLRQPGWPVLWSSEVVVVMRIVVLRDFS